MKRDKLLLIAFLVILGVFGGLLARKYLLSTPAIRPLAVTEQPAAPTALREIILYFASADDGSLLEAEGREIEDCLTEEDCLQATLQALINGSVGELTSVLPTPVTLRAVRLKDDLVTVDFSREFISAHPGGSHAELLTVYAVTDTLAVNFPYVRQVRFLVEGEAIDTIKGHVDLRAPIVADFRYTRRGDTLSEIPAEFFQESTESTAEGNR
jgi:spore germination protein GerM